MEERFRTDEIVQYKVSLVLVSSCSNIGSIRDDPYWTTRENSLELTELSSIKKISLVFLVLVSSSSNTGSIRGDPYWTSRENSLELIDIRRAFARNVESVFIA